MKRRFPASLTTNRAGGLFLGVVLFLAACSGETVEPELTASIAERVIMGSIHDSEPVYAEVPRRVSWSPHTPRDDFDGLSITTLEKMEDAGLVVLTRTGSSEEGSLQAELTGSGREILGIVPSARGEALRGRIAKRVFDGVRAFERHPERPDVGRAELVWHYEDPTPLHAIFDTKPDNQIGRPFSSVVAIHREGGIWRAEVIVSRQPSGP